MELVKYLHATSLSPVKSTMIVAIKKHQFKSWPGLTPQIISKHLTLQAVMVHGYFHQEHQNLQSTKSEK